MASISLADKLKTFLFLLSSINIKTENSNWNTPAIIHIRKNQKNPFSFLV